MHIAILAPIATEDLLSEAVRQNLGSYPKGYEGAPLTSALINEYVSRGHRVLAITTDSNMAENEPPFVYTATLLTFIVIPSRRHTFRFQNNRPGRALDCYRFERKRMVDMLKAHQPEVTHAHWSYEFAMAALAYTPGALITIHDDPWVILKYMKTPLRFIRLLMAQYVFYRGRRFTTISPYMADAIKRFIPTGITVIPNPLTTPDYQPSPQTPAPRVIAAIVNGWDKRKNGERLLLAFKAIQAQHPDLVLWAMGTAFEPDGVASAFCKTHAIDNVICWGKLPHAEILKKLAASYLLLHTSLEESFGMVLIEAMSYGVPVVAGRHSGAVPWIVQENGLLVDVTNVEAIAEAINRLLQDPSLHSSLAKHARESVKSRFSITSVADQYISLYQPYKAVSTPLIN